MTWSSGCRRSSCATGCGRLRGRRAWGTSSQTIAPGSVWPEPHGVWDRTVGPDDGGEVVQPDDAPAVHAGAAGRSRHRGNVLWGVGQGGAIGWGSTTEGQRWPALLPDARI